MGSAPTPLRGLVGRAAHRLPMVVEVKVDLLSCTLPSCSLRGLPSAAPRDPPPAGGLRTSGPRGSSIEGGRRAALSRRTTLTAAPRSAASQDFTLVVVQNPNAEQ